MIVGICKIGVRYKCIQYSKYAYMCIFIYIHILDAIFLFLLVAKCVLACALWVSPSPLQQIFLFLESGMLMDCTLYTVVSCCIVVSILSIVYHDCLSGKRPSGLFHSLIQFHKGNLIWHCSLRAA